MLWVFLVTACMVGYWVGLVVYLVGDLVSYCELPASWPLGQLICFVFVFFGKFSRLRFVICQGQTLRLNNPIYEALILLSI